MELNIYIEKLKKLIEKAITNYETQIAKVAIGRANPTLISKINLFRSKKFVQLQYLVLCN